MVSHRRTALVLGPGRPSLGTTRSVVTESKQSRWPSVARRMTCEREELLALLDELNQAIANAAEALDASRADNRRFRKLIAEGTPLRDALPTVPVPESRASVGEALKDMEQKRHQLRRMVVVLGVTEGMALAEVARLYGISRQLASRLAAETRDDGEYAPP
jgi:hypothetical protein